MTHHDPRNEQEDLEEVQDILDQWGMNLSPKTKRGLQQRSKNRFQRGKAPRKLEDFK